MIILNRNLNIHITLGFQNANVNPKPRISRFLNFIDYDVKYKFLIVLGYHENPSYFWISAMM